MNEYKAEGPHEVSQEGPQEASLMRDFFSFIFPMLSGKQERADFSLMELDHWLYTHPLLQRSLSFMNHFFRDKSLLRVGLTHSSFVHEFAFIQDWGNIADMKLEHNEKLEFLGDAILQAIVSTELYLKFTHLKEGDLSKLRGSLVNKETLSQLGRFLGLHLCLLLGRGELKVQRGDKTDSLAANALEAVIGALYLDGGLSVAKDFVLQLIKQYEGQIGESLWNTHQLEKFDAKTRLQELTMAKFKVLPEYRLLQSLPGDRPPFLVALYIEGKEVARVEDISKKKAERTLANQALQMNLMD